MLKYRQKMNNKNKEQMGSNRNVDSFDLNPTMSISMINVNGMGPPIRWQRLLDWIFRKQNQSMCSLQKTLFKHKDKNKLKIQSVRKDTLCKH